MCTRPLCGIDHAQRSHSARNASEAGSVGQQIFIAYEQSHSKRPAENSGSLSGFANCHHHPLAWRSSPHLGCGLSLVTMGGAGTLGIFRLTRTWRNPQTSARRGSLFVPRRGTSQWLGFAHSLAPRFNLWRAPGNLVGYEHVSTLLWSTPPQYVGCSP